MCELLGMSANVPTDICFSFSGLMQRGGITGPHKDGWGIAFYEGRGSRVFHDPLASSDSAVAGLVRKYPIKSHIVISHIRQANRGRVCLENTHPFTRELWGRIWTFAHNGQLKGIKKLPLSFYQPVGTTDSEYALCWMMGKIREKYPQRPKTLSKLWRFIGELCLQLSRLGVFNLLFSDSTFLYTFCSTKLCWITRKAPFGEAKLLDEELSIDFSSQTTAKDIVTVIATKPLTGNEQWNSMQPGEYRVFRNGESPFTRQTGG